MSSRDKYGKLRITMALRFVAKEVNDAGTIRYSTNNHFRVPGTRWKNSGGEYWTVLESHKCESLAAATVLKKSLMELL